MSRRWGVVMLAVWAALSLWAIPALAHAVLVRSSPDANARLASAPAAVEMWFSEPLEPGVSTARLLESTGKQVATGPAVIDRNDPLHLTLPLGNLGPGVYTVVYQNVSQADGHEWSGSFPFTVLNADGSSPAGGGAVVLPERSETPGLAEAVARWLTLLGGIVFFAAPLFRYGLNLPSPEEKGGAAWRDAADGLATRAVWLATLAMLVGGVVLFTIRALRLGGLDTLPDLLFATRSGSLLLARQALAFTGGLALLAGAATPGGRNLRLAMAAYVALVGTMLALLVAALRGQTVVGVGAVILSAVTLGTAWAFAGDAAVQTDRQRRNLWAAQMALAALALLTFSLSGHPRAVSAGAVVSDWVHLLCAAAWVGGLALLPVFLWQTRDMADRPVATWANRFSQMAAFAVLMLVITGLFGAAVQLPTLDSLWTTAYGRALLVKLALVAVMLAVAFANNRLVHRRVARLAGADGARRLQRRMAIEGVIGVAVLLSVAVLVQTPTPRGAATDETPSVPSGFSAIVQSGDLLAHLEITPNRVGDNHFWVHLYHADNSPIGEVQLVRLVFAYQEADMGQSELDLPPLGGDSFAADGANLSQAGQWLVRIYVRRRGLDDVLMEAPVSVPAP